MGVTYSKQLRQVPEKLVVTKQLDIPSNAESFDQTLGDVNGEAELDPRSPHVCRTPIQEVIKFKEIVTKPQNLTEIWNDPNKQLPTSAILAQKLINKLKFDPLDPRSPSLFINRTPIVFDDSSDGPVCVDVDREVGGDQIESSTIGVFEKSFANVEKEETDPYKARSSPAKSDPRSASEGVERTPIVPSEEISDQEILQSVMHNFNSGDIQNTKLERLKNPRGRGQRTLGNKGVYEDKSSQFFVSSTPKRILESNAPKRTPLSCVANKSHLRSKSVENTGKTMTGKIQVSSYDDYSLKSRQNLGGSGESPHAAIGRRLNI